MTHLTRPKRRARYSLHVEQTVETEAGKIRTEKTIHAREEKDGTVTEIERQEVADSSEASPWFSTGTVRERRTVRRERE